MLPAFNEASNLREAVGRCVRAGESLGLRFEVVVVNDGSVDATRDVMRGLCAADPRVRALHHPHNRGYGAALRSGLLAAKMSRVFFTDADLQFDVAEVGRLLALAERYGVVAGYRAPRRDPWVRCAVGWAWSRLVGAMFQLDVRDVDCAFKVFDRRIFDRIPVQSLGALVNTEILVRSRAAGFTFTQVPVSHYPRQRGAQTGLKPRVVARALGELWSMRAELTALSTQAGWPSPDETHSIGSHD